MKLLIVAVLAVVAVAVAAPQNEPAAEAVKILRSAFDQQPDGPYNFNSESEDGIPQNIVVVRNSYSYPGEDGQASVVNHYADETGEGDSIPKAQR